MSERPIRIGLLVVAFPRLSETFIVTKVLKLLAAGFDVRIFTLTADSDWDRFDVLRGRDDVRMRIHPMPPTRSLASIATAGAASIVRSAFAHPKRFWDLASHRWIHRADSPLSFLKALYEQSRFAEFELDILHVEFDFQAAALVDLKEYFGCRLVLSARGTLQSSSTFSPESAQRLFAYVDAYHVISSYLERTLDELGLPTDVPRWHIEPAIDLSLFKPVDRSLHGGPLRIVSVGRLSWAKGYEFGLQAIRHVKDRGVDVRYTIVGWGPYEEAVRYAIRQFRLEDCVELVGARPREDLPAFYAQADLMLHASVDEGFCNAVIEAQAMAVAVVSSDAGGLPENVEHGVTGLVVPRRDAGALADAIVELARSPTRRREMGVAGRKRALERFDLDRQAEAFVAMYNQLEKLPIRRIGHHEPGHRSRQHH